MITTQERHAIHLKVVESFFPEIAAGKDKTRLVPPAYTRPQFGAHSFSWSQIQSYLDRLGPLPDHCLSLGTCRDGLPLLIDLADPGLGSILVQNGSAAAPERLLEYIRLCHLNQPELAAADLISIGDWSVRADPPGLAKAFPEDSDSAYACIYSLAEEIEARRNGRVWRRNPITLLVEDLGAYTSHLDDETVNYLAWIIHSGGPVHVHLISAVRKDMPETTRRRLLPAFQHLITPSTGLPAETGRYRTRLGGETVQFNLPV